MSGIVADASGDGWHALVLPGALLATSLTLVAWLQFAPQPSKPVVVFFAPGTDRAQALMAAVTAGGRIIGAGAWDNSIIVQSADPDFFRRLRAAGAWLIADATGRGGCTAKPSSPTQDLP
jgi:hypothetical protein